MADLPARRVVRALERAGFVVVRQRGSHRVLRHADGRQLTFAYHENIRLASTALRRCPGRRALPRALARVGLTTEHVRGPGDVIPSVLWMPLQTRACRFQILRVEAFAEPLVDGRQERAGLG